MILLWLIILILSHQHPPDHLALMIQHWEDRHVFLTILILVFLG
jgi:hypothetical protein